MIGRLLSLAISLPLLGGCGAPSVPTGSYFPVVAGMQWRYEVTTESAGHAETSSFSVRAESPESVQGSAYAVRVTSDGTSYYIAADARGIYRAAKRTLVQSEAVLEESPYWIIRKPFQQGTNWTNTTHPFVLRRINPYEEKLARSMQLKMAYRIAAVNDSVRVPAGRFENCLRVEGNAQFTIYADGRSGYAEIPLNTTEWYAPDVGLVKLVREEPLATDVFTGGRVTFELSEFSR